MSPSERANLARWRGQSGFVEVWFLVLFTPRPARAAWLRYSLYVPAPGVPGTPRGTVWAAWFEAGGAKPAIAAKSLHPIDAATGLDGDRFAIRVGSSALAHDRASGTVTTDAGELTWDLSFTSATQARDEESWILRKLPVPSHVARANPDLTFRGTVTVDGTPRRVDGARGLQMHIWGTRRPEELLWLYCPLFEQDPSARLEVATARLSRRLVGTLPGPWVSPMSWHAAEGAMSFTRLGRVLRSPAAGVVECRARTGRQAITARAWCAPDTLVGYVYREPDGRELYVAQSDIGSCEVDVSTRQRAARLTSRYTTALEFHGPEPLPGVRYIPWNAER